MKTIKLFGALLFTVIISAQSESVINFTYYDIPANKIGKFLKLHNQISDYQLEEERKLQQQCVYLHN